MTDAATATKPWQRGYPIEDLLRIEAIYQRFYNCRTVSPFEAVKKHIVAERLARGTLKVASDGAWAYDLAAGKTKTDVKLFKDLAIGTRQAGDLVLSKIAASWRDASWLSELKRLSQTANASMWVQTWAGDREANEAIARYATRVGSKVSTYGDIFSWHLREVADRTLFDQCRVASIAPIHYFGIKRVATDSALGLHVSRLADAVAGLRLTFTNHYSNYNAKDAWSALALRGYFSDPARIEKPSEMNDKWHEQNEGVPFALQDTPLRAQLPEVEPLLDLLAPSATWHRVRLMRLAPGGGELERHTDQVDADSGVGVGQLMRLHVPLFTNPDVKFTVWNQDDAPKEIHMQVGEVWMVDTRWPHRAVNGGTSERVHLVMDVVVTPSLQEMVMR